MIIDALNFWHLCWWPRWCAGVYQQYSVGRRGPEISWHQRVRTTVYLPQEEAPLDNEGQYYINPMILETCYIYHLLRSLAEKIQNGEGHLSQACWNSLLHKFSRWKRGCDYSKPHCVGSPSLFIGKRAVRRLYEASIKSSNYKLIGRNISLTVILMVRTVCLYTSTYGSRPTPTRTWSSTCIGCPGGVRCGDRSGSSRWWSIDSPNARDRRKALSVQPCWGTI